ncbi:MAG: SdpI family protein [Thomasclavelia ramosa]
MSWLLNDEESWDKTHKLASYTWILAGNYFYSSTFVSPLKC